MVLLKFDLSLLIIFFHVSHCERRIAQGEQVTSDKSYVVYLVKARESDQTYDTWLCGGALVSKDFIITSAACVEDVLYMYAIAGYRKYVDDKNLETDGCTKQLKKKIVYTCVPLSYKFGYEKIEEWAHIDIALAKVESPYNFDDARFQLMCSYVPSIIPINYDHKRQANNVDAMVLGWGHTEFWRQHGDLVNYNTDFLRFSSTTLFDKKKCQEEYTEYPDLRNIIDKYMICTMGPGYLNDHGLPYAINKPGRSGCITQEQNSMGFQGCEVPLTSEKPEQALMNHLVHDGDETRKRMSINEKSYNITNINGNGTGFVKGTDNDNGTDIVHGTDIMNRTDIVNGTDIANGIDIANGTNIVNATDIANGTDIVNGTDFIHKPGLSKISGYSNRTFTRRNGICQNDHGGPLVTWVGKREVLIGVASVFKITETNQCVGPFLYTSTMCSGAFLGCMLDDRRANILRGQNTSISTSQALLCDSPPSVKGFDTVESYVSWKDHPAGPADNEKHMGVQLETNLKRDRYATYIKRDSEEDVDPLNDSNTENKIFRNFPPKKHDTNDRFSLRIGLPPGVRPPSRNRRPLRNRPPPKREPPQLAPSPITRLSPEIKPSAIIWPPRDMVPSPIRAPPETGPSPILRPPPQIEPPAFDEILNFKIDESLRSSKPSSVVEPEIQIRPQSPFGG